MPLSQIPGSMESARTDTIGGFNAFLAEQVDDASDVNVTLAQFDNEYDVVYLGEPIRQAPRLTADTYVPRRTTRCSMRSAARFVSRCRRLEAAKQGARQI